MAEMTASEVVQYAADNIGIVRGAEVDFGLPDELPCSLCGGMVRLDSPITVRILEADGTEAESTMTEANARQFMAECGLVPPPVICELHAELVNA